ncbi:MAG TPA: sugar phosphate isomerase/epimerase [Gemmatimonadales bacterium]|nr:sugar phosphate isomerase/epimerase [Gemmatimonadales bacterium]
MRLNRREFLGAAGATWAGANMGFGLGSGDRAGRWWTWKPAKLGPIGIQLYTVRNELARDVEGTLRRLATIGYREVEFAGYPSGTAQSLRKILDRLGLKAPSSHVGLSALRGGWDKALDQAATLGQRYVVVASIPENERRTVDDWKRVAGLFNKAGETALARGIRLGYHNHELEFEPIEGRLPYDVLLQETDPKLVVLEMDLYWITRGGQDPLAYFAKWPGRFPLVHVKDMDATPRRFFADLGKGTIDFPAIFRKAQQAGITHYFYEQDETPGSVFDSAKASYEYLRALRF